MRAAGLLLTRDTARENTADPPFPHIARALRESRIAAKLTQEKTAQAFGLTFAGYRPYERGERDLTTAQIERFAVIFGITPAELVRRISPDEPSPSRTTYSGDLDQIGEKLERTTDARARARALIRAFNEMAEAMADSDATHLARRN